MTQPSASPPDRIGRGFLAVLSLMLTIAVVPLTASRYLPLVDLPMHASQVAMWQAYDHDSAIRHVFQLDFRSPYLLLYVFWRGLLALGVSLESGARILIAAYLVLLPLSVMALLRARRRPLLLTLFAFPFLYSRALSWGLLPFCLATPLFFFATTSYSRWLEERRFRDGLITALTGCVIVLGHGLVAGFWGIACGVLAICRVEPLRARAAALFPLLPSGALLSWWALRAASAKEPVSAMTPLVLRAHRLRGSLVGGFTSTFRDIEQIALVVVLVVAALALMLSARRKAPLQFWKRLDLPIFAAAASLLAVYFLLPDYFLGCYGDNNRAVLFALLLLIVAVPPLPPLLQRLGAAILCGLSILITVELTSAFRDFNRRLGDASELFHVLPHGASVVRPAGAPVNLDSYDTPVLEHLATWAGSETLGPTDTFSFLPHMLVQFRSEHAWPTFDLRLEAVNDGTPRLHSDSGLLPDDIVFYSERLFPVALDVQGSAESYRLLRHTGNLYCFARSGDRR